MAKKTNGKDKKFKDNRKPNKRSTHNQSCDKVRDISRPTDIDTDMKKYGGNDISWYTRYPELTQAASRVPFAWQPGRDIPYLVKSPWTEEGEDVRYLDKPIKYPGIISLGFVPAVGVSTDVASPINVAAREVYGRIRSKYSGALEADAPDIMMYMLAVDSLYMMYEDMKRAYYCINQYTPYNTLYPKAIIAALGYDFDDLLENKTLMYQRIVEAGAMLRKFMVPDTMDLFKRHQFMCSNIYADSPDKKSQQYVFRLAGYYQLANVDTMTKLESVMWSAYDQVGDEKLTVETAWTKWYNAMQILMNWDTSYTIVGYLERAYEGSTFLAPTPILEDGILEPVYNSEVLLQIHNATVQPIVDQSNNVEQDVVGGNVLISKPEVDLDFGNPEQNKLVAYAANDLLLSVPGDGTPSPEHVIIATRLAASVDNNGTNYLTCGTEILIDIDMFMSPNGAKDGGNYFPSGTVNELNYGGHHNSEFTLFNSLLRYSALLSAFQYHPHIFIRMQRLDTGNNEVYNWCWSDLENITTINHATAENLHRMCVYSEFNCFSV